MRYRTGFGGWLRGPQSLLWLAAVMLYGIGDLLTTTVGLRQRGIVEVGPVAAPVVAQYGTVGLVVLKCWLLLGSYLLWRAIPRPHHVGVPLGLAVAGLLITSWNAAVIWPAVG